MRQQINLYNFGLSITNLLNLSEKMIGTERADIVNITREEITLIIAGLTMYYAIGDGLKRLTEAVNNLNER